MWIFKVLPFFCEDLPTFSVTSKKFLTRLIERPFPRALFVGALRLKQRLRILFDQPLHAPFWLYRKGIGAKVAFLFWSSAPYKWTHRFDEFFTLLFPSFLTILRPRIYCALRFYPGLLFVGASAEKCAKNRYFTQIRPRRKKHGTMLDGGGIGFQFCHLGDLLHT